MKLLHVMPDPLYHTIIPEDPETGLPALCHAIMEPYLLRFDLYAEFDAFAETLQNACQEHHSKSFDALSESERLAMVTRLQRTHRRLTTSVITHCLRAYYTHAEILHRISAGAVPPFPQGNTLDEDDWLLLECVYQRGKFYRMAPS